MTLERTLIPLNNHDFRLCAPIIPHGKLFLGPANQESRMPASLLWLVFSLPGQPPSGTANQPPDFHREVLPVLRDHCFKCHSHQAGKSKGGVVLDSRAALSEPGESGHLPINVLVPAIRREKEAAAMPPAKPLDDRQVEILSRWVKAGSPWPGMDGKSTTSPRPRGQVSREDRQWWAVQPLKPGKPGVTLDHLILQRLEKNQIPPAPPARPADWLRRVTYDLTGLPPDPEQVRAFLKDPSPGAKAAVVDSLLSGPAFGEKWARLWLDLVRYADSDGYRADAFRPDAWRYRDWVVQAFQNDMPYDRFVRLQLAADELEPGNLSEARALGYLRLGIYEYNQRDAPAQWDTILDEITDVTGDAVLGLGLACARCHDHKFDPIPQRDYHALRAYFTALSWPEQVPAVPPSQVAESENALQQWRSANGDKLARLTQMEESARKKARDSAVEKFPPDIQKLLGADPGTLGPRDRQVRDLAWRQVEYEFEHLENHFPAGEKRESWRNLKLELDASRPKPPPMMMVAADVGPEAPTSGFNRRGKLEVVSPGVPALLDRLPPAEITPRPQSSGRRSALAQWLTRSDHPLTARVWVNRVWASLFGTGLVATTSDFGTLGDKPSHPELLDLLAGDFIRDGWRLKSLVRKIVLSDAYSRSSTHPEEAACRQKDPENRLLWRGPFRRLTAEEIRDSMLASAGLLDRTVGGPTAEPGKNRRSLYLPARRNARDQMLASFDAADGVISTPLRQNTVTVVQTLLLANGPLTRQAAGALAKRATREKPDLQTESLVLLALGRPATREELDSGRDTSSSPVPLEDLAAALLQSNAFLYLD